MNQTLLSLGFSAVLAFLVGCSAGSAGSAGCVPGRVAACVCDDGERGTSTCVGDGSFASCVCGGVPGNDGGTGVDSGQLDAGSTPDGSTTEDSGTVAESEYYGQWSLLELNGMAISDTTRMVLIVEPTTDDTVDGEAELELTEDGVWVCTRETMFVLFPTSNTSGSVTETITDSSCLGDIVGGELSWDWVVTGNRLTRSSATSMPTELWQDEAS